MEDFVTWIGISVMRDCGWIVLRYRPGTMFEVIQCEFSDEGKGGRSKGGEDAGIVDGDASAVGGGENEAGAVRIVIIVDMIACDLQLLVELVNAGNSGIIAPAMIVKAEIESAVVGGCHTARLGGIVDGVNAGVEWKNLQDVSLGGDP